MGNDKQLSAEEYFKTRIPELSEEKKMALMKIGASYFIIPWIHDYAAQKTASLQAEVERLREAITKIENTYKGEFEMPSSKALKKIQLIANEVLTSKNK